MGEVFTVYDRMLLAKNVLCAFPNSYRSWLSNCITITVVMFSTLVECKWWMPWIISYKKGWFKCHFEFDQCHFEFDQCHCEFDQCHCEFDQCHCEFDQCHFEFDQCHCEFDQCHCEFDQCHCEFDQCVLFVSLTLYVINKNTSNQQQSTNWILHCKKLSFTILYSEII